MGSVSIEYLEHTADVGIRITASDFGDLFRSAALALVSLIVDPAGLRGGRIETIAFTAEDAERLLFQWLNELLFLLDARGFIPVNLAGIGVEETDPGAWRLSGTMDGDTLDRERHEYRTYVKAVTYHRLRIDKRASEFVAEFYVDV